MTEHYVDWYKKQVSSPPRLNKFPSHVDAFERQLWPFAQNYYSSLNPVFLLQLMGHLDFNIQNVWQIRDGYEPLSHFFQIHPSPNEIRTKFLVRADLIQHVPREWSRYIGTYRVVSQAKPQRKHKVLIIGGCSQTLHSVQALRNLDLGRLRNRDVEVYFPRKYFSPDTDETHALRYATALVQALGKTPKSLGWNQLQFKASFAGYEVVELSENRLLADNYLLHLTLSRGASVQTQSLTKNESFVPLSPYHGLAVNFNITPGRLARRVARRENAVYPWEDWFVPWHRSPE